MVKPVAGGITRPVSLEGDAGDKIKRALPKISRDPLTASFAELDTAGEYTPWFRLCDLPGPRPQNHSFTFVVGGLGTSVTVRIEGTLSTEYNPATESAFLLDASGNNTTYTTEGRKLQTKANCPLAQVRGQLVSSVGGAATLTGMEYRGDY